MTKPASKNVIFLVIVAALGYFVDIYDLVLFSIVRVQSFKDIGITNPEDITANGEFVLNMQMGGLLLGGILWGVLGDKIGRVRVLFGSILLYSLANFANGMVADINTYAFIRLIAGIGLAGELGAGITLVSETMSKENRGYGTMIVAGVGLLGAVAANMVNEMFSWKTAFFVGGGMGLLLLALRVGTFESGMFKGIAGKKVARGDVRLLLFNGKRLYKYVCCILIGAPLWFVVGILVTQAMEFGSAKALNATSPLSAGKGIMFTYIGISIGDILAGLLAQVTRSRKLTMMVFLLLSLVSVTTYLRSYGLSPETFRWLCLFMGISVGYWATFVTIASEQFGTNIRATVTTTVPNFVRGALIPITFAFGAFRAHFGTITAAYLMMGILSVLSLFALSQLKETFGKDLDYMEGEELEIS
ncbi:MFS transporter [Hufsiella ginkgonis]|uniref:MFS transporter n=1 Tax=Hufsiella ginkgonis TaxID=2695274 RepID=A0A7K1XVL7_9SPHI|nr:MFS transporter [Hufsiella ginkgonis]MXV15022.1 MFS transporter [Hufsiella ginkgonis]